MNFHFDDIAGTDDDEALRFLLSFGRYGSAINAVPNSLEIVQDYKLFV